MCSSTKAYPSDLLPSEIYVDMEGQVVFVPINGTPVPFHISMIKNAVQPDPDRASAQRIGAFDGKKGKKQ